MEENNLPQQAENFDSNIVLSVHDVMEIITGTAKGRD